MRVCVEFLAAAQLFFGGEVGAEFGEGLLGGFEGRFGAGDSARGLGHLLAKALELKVLCVKDDEMFEVWVHGCLDGALQNCVRSKD
jgi:hypothetical protein